MFRFGFICYPVADPPVATEAWQQMTDDWKGHPLGEFELLLHPEAELAARTVGDTSVAVIGPAASVDYPRDDLLQRLATGDDTEIVELVEGMTGRFALIVSSPEEVQAFNDPFGSRSLFYREGRPFAVSSHSPVLAMAYGSPLSESTARFIETEAYQARNMKWLPGDTTVYGDIFGLIPNNYLDLRRGGTARFWPTAPRRDTTFDEFFDRADEAFRATASLVAGRRTVVGYTSGLDSRTVIAYLNHYDVPVDAVTWMGPYVQPREHEVIHQLLDHRPTPHAWLDTPAHRETEIAVAASINSGTHRNPSSIASAMHAHCGADLSAVFVRGVGAEIVRGAYNLGKTPMKDLSTDEMTRLYSTKLKKVEPSSAYLQTVTSGFEEYRQRANYEGLDRWGYDPNDIFYWEHRMAMLLGAMCNELDLAVDNLVGFNGRRLYETAFGLADETRLTKELLRKVIARYDPGLAAIKYH